MVEDFNRYQTWPPLLLKKENLTKISIKKILKNPEKGQLLSDFSHNQTWLPPLLKIEHLTKKCKNYIKKNPVQCQLLPNLSEIIQL